MPSQRSTRLIATFCAMLTAWPTVSAASSVGPYGVQRVTMLEDDEDGRPLTFSESDIFACVMTRGDQRASVYRVPYGYVTDQTSLPRRSIAFLLGKDGRLAMFANAAIVHDYLYASGERTDKAARRRADEIMAELLAAEHVQPRIVEIISLAFSLARGTHGVITRLIQLLRLDGMLQVKEFAKSLEGAFGTEEEWTRWANPYTLRLIGNDHRPRLPDDALPVTHLRDCRVFDGAAGDEVDRRRLHACLHFYFPSPPGRPLLLNADNVTRTAWPAPRMPVALLNFITPVDAPPAGVDRCDRLAVPS